MSNVVDITSVLATNEIQTILDLDRENARVFYEKISSGISLARALRDFGLRSASELSPETWEMLRSWRGRYFSKLL